MCGYLLVRNCCCNCQKIENSHLTLSRMHYTASNLQTGIKINIHLNNIIGTTKK